MDLSALMIKMFIFLVLLLTGYFLVRKEILDGSFVKNASALLIDVFIVCSIINSVLGDRPQLSNAELGKVLLIISASLVLVYVLGFLACKLFKKTDELPQIEMILSVANNLFVGLPLLQSVYGNEAVFYVGMSCVPYNIILYSYGVWRLKKGKGESGIRIKDMFSVCLIAALVALLIFLINPPIPRLVSELFSTVSAATVPLSMIVIGASMGAINPAKAFGEKRNYLIALIRLIIIPLIVFYAFRPFVSNHILLVTCSIIAGCPVAVIVTPLSVKYGYNPETSSKAIMVTTVLCMLTLPVLFYIFG